MEQRCCRSSGLTLSQLAQEAKVPEAKLTKDVACVEGFEVRAPSCPTMMPWWL